MKKLYGLLLITILMFTGCKKGNNDLTPSNGDNGLKFSLNFTRNSYIVTGIADTKNPDIVIPSTYKGLPVVGIWERAFYRNSFIRSLKISEGVRSIEKEAFYECSSLTSVTIPKSVRLIGESAFSYCNALNKVSISDGVKTINDSAFAVCPSLASVRIPKSVTDIGAQAFSGFDSLTIYCEANSKPNEWDSDWKGSLSHVYWGINENNYLEQDGLIYLIINGNAVVAGREFIDIKDIVISPTITIGENNYNVTKIGDYAFYNSYFINSVSIPDGIEVVGKSAFQDSRKLVSIFIPDSVTSIEESAFFGCGSLNVYCEANKQPSEWNSGWKESMSDVYWGINEDNYIEQDGLVYVVLDKSAIVVGYKPITPDVIIPSTITIKETDYSVTSILDNAFIECTNITSVVIPESVISIGQGVFNGCSSLWSLTLPYIDTFLGYYFGSTSYKDNELYVLRSLSKVVITGGNKIDDYAFYNCKDICDIVLSSGIISIGVKAFEGCDRLNNVYFNGTLEDWCKINFKSYDVNPMNCASNFYLLNENNEYEKVEEIIIPDTITSIGDYQFYGFDKLISIAIPSSVTSIGNSAFEGCSSLTSITLQDGVTKIGDRAFYNCNSLTSIKIPNTVTFVGKDAFFGCRSLQYNEYENCLYLGNEKNPYLMLAKAKTNYKEEVMVHEETKFINDYAFSDCGFMTSVSIPDGLISIGKNAFASCDYLASIEIPSSVTSIGEFAFPGYAKLTVFCEASSQPSGWNSNWIGSNCIVYWGITKEDTLNLQDGFQFLIKNQEALLVKGISIPSDVVIPSTVALDGNEYRVTSIGKRAFSNYSIESIEIPDSVTSIGEYAFYNCNSLSTIAIPSSVTSIGNSAFEGCSSLPSIVIPNSVTSIGDNAFSGCSSLTIYCEASSQPSGWYSSDYSSWNSGRPLYWGISYLEQDGLIYIVADGNALVTGHKENITDVVIPSTITVNGTEYNVTSIEKYAFHDCESLTSITIPDGVTSIGEYAFSGCSLLSTIVIPDSVTSIGKYAFYDCKSLSTIAIPNSVTSIGEFAFSGCSLLSTIVIPDSVISIGKKAFARCKSLTIFCEASSQPSEWNSSWNPKRPVYWAGQWSYVDGVPTPNSTL